MIIGVAKRGVVTSSKFMVLNLMHVASSKYFVREGCIDNL